MEKNISSAPSTIVVRSSRRGGVVVLVALALGGLTAFGAHAASLGGLDSRQLGASSGVVASCDTDGVITRYDPIYNPETASYSAGVVVVEKIAKECEGQLMQVTVADEKGNALGSQSVRVEGDGMKLTEGFRAVQASQVANIAVVISN